MLKDKTEKKIKKKNLSQPDLTCQMRNPWHKIEITLYKKSEKSTKFIPNQSNVEEWNWKKIILKKKLKKDQS